MFGIREISKLPNGLGLDIPFNISRFKLFKDENLEPIFSRNTDVNKTAFLNWRMAEGEDTLNMANLADGYFKSAISLLKMCLEDNDDKKADIYIFPVMAIANHGIELYLKTLIWIFNTLLQIDRKIEGRHDLKQLYQTLTAKIQAYRRAIYLKEFKVESKVLKEYIEELSKVVGSTEKRDKMDFARYHLTNNYENHFYVENTKNIELDLENYLSKIQLIHTVFQGMYNQLIYVEMERDIY